MVSYRALAPCSRRLIVYRPTPAWSASSRCESPTRFRRSASDGTGTPLVWPPTLLSLPLPHFFCTIAHPDFSGVALAPLVSHSCSTHAPLMPHRLASSVYRWEGTRASVRWCETKRVEMMLANGNIGTSFT